MEIHAPFAGTIRYHVAVGDTVGTGDHLATIEAAKLEASVNAPGPGVVTDVDRGDFTDVGGGDRILTLGERK
ncbi:biotin/lipoyl-containing protein [Corynebacterium frankenforstense]|uniref:biotin/lipoyl-containing protein n=1 Tax=Corynebacterium frankenforstense TaxID=1230998 RepID=UPI0026EAEE65|nr:biotin/lipoyl-containing protein [Corynebacterium frankenforstense]